MADLGLVLQKLIAPSKGVSQFLLEFRVAALDVLEHLGNLPDLGLHEVPILVESDVL